MFAVLLHASTDGNPLAHLWWWVEIHVGATNEPGAYYGFWSGFGSDIGEIAIIGAVFAMYKKHNCHVAGCWRMARHPVEGTPYIVCRRHHPAVPKVITAEHIVDAHRKAN